MKSKLIKLFCGIALSLFVCAGIKASCSEPTTQLPITYSTILDNMDSFAVNAFDDEGHLLTNDGIEIAKAYWATVIIDMMAAQHLTAHWLDQARAELGTVSQIYDESFNVTLMTYPTFEEYLRTFNVRRDMKIALGLTY